MSKLLIPFDSSRHHIYVEFELLDDKGIVRKGRGILDTGAPRTEFAGSYLSHLGILDIGHNADVKMPDGQQTKKYHKIVLPSVSICGHHFKDTEFIVSRFEKSWGIHALIGLDLFRNARITIDYKSAQIISEPYELKNQLVKP